MARPPIYDESMTDAERMRRYRARKREGNQSQPKMTVRQSARVHRVSERTCYYARAFIRNSLIEWGDVLAARKYGRIGVAFLAEVCQYGSAEEQREVHDCIKQNGAAAGRKLWQEIIERANSGYSICSMQKRATSATIVAK
jgi:hypothetical protein